MPHESEEAGSRAADVVVVGERASDTSDSYRAKSALTSFKAKASPLQVRLLSLCRIGRYHLQGGMLLPLQDRLLSLRRIIHSHLHGGMFRQYKTNCFAVSGGMGKGKPRQ
ncbi:unnamed protein product [Dovyalis caffra]|uniref:Uncharacterized protein n=1 Tax=Dovyalis caffra TaxID=77055 RepID=A0AAV1REV0_9ROSI|nr:unnamed protein product [Dovyalis caffra]